MVDREMRRVEEDARWDVEGDNEGIVEVRWEAGCEASWIG